MESIARKTRVLELMIQEMDSRSMDRLMNEWNEWDAPCVQRPAIRRWLRDHSRTNEVNLMGCSSPGATGLRHSSHTAILSSGSSFLANRLR